MRICLILSILTLLVTANLKAQSTKDSIIFNRAFWGNSYYIDGKEVSFDVIYTKLISQTESNMLLQESISHKNWAWRSLVVGMLFNISTLQSIYYSYRNYEKAPNSTGFYSVAAIAVGFDIVAIIYFSLSKKSFGNSIKAYNSNLNKDSGFNEMDLKINGNRISFTYSL